MTSSSRTRDQLIVTSAIGATFMGGLDLFVVNVALDDIAHSVGVGRPDAPSAADLSWVLNAYAVTFAALLVPFGQLADRHGNKTVFLFGLGLFTAASAACAFAGSLWVLVALRVLQAAGAAAMTPTSLSILLTALPPEARLGAVRLWAVTGAIAATVGPTVGGLLTQLGWEWIFLINLPLGAVLLPLAASAIPSSATNEAAAEPDLPSAAFFAATVALFSLALVQSEDWGWVDLRMLVVAAGVAACGTAFATRSRRHSNPIIPATLLRSAQYRLGLFSVLTFNAAFSIALLAGIMWLQQIWSYSPMLTGCAVAAGPVLVPVTASLAHRLWGAIDPRLLVLMGSLICAGGSSLMAVLMESRPEYVLGYLPGWLLVGVGVGLAAPNLLAGVTYDLAPHLAATGSAVATMARQIGYVLGVSILFAIVGDMTAKAALPGYRESLLAATVLFATAAASAAYLLKRQTVELTAASR